MTATQETETKPETAPAELAEGDSPADGDTITINFVEDGFTGLGKIWYRGEELSVVRGSDDWKRTLMEPGGRSWLELNEAEQEERYGRRMFREGRWQGKPYEVTDDLTEEQKAELAKVNAERFGAGGETTKPKSTRKRRTPAAPKRSRTDEE